MRTLFLISALLITFSCKNRSVHRPDQPFSTFTPPEAPDYSDPVNWAALPDKKDEADGVPRKSGLQDGQADSPADVFFIHPTIFFSDEAWNADIKDEKLNKKVDESTIRHQASIFNAAGRVYAPRYREATFGTFTIKEDKKSQYQTIELAYRDVRDAFRYYLENYNEGRPFFIASHSQGTVHAIRLIREWVDGKEIQDRMITAYLAGWPIPADTFKSLPPCQNPDDVNCFTSWCTFTEGFYPDNLPAFKGAVSTNPVNWKITDEKSSYAEHKGTVMKGYKKILPEIFEVQSQPEEGILWISKPKLLGASIYNQKVWHVADFNIFWLDVRENAVNRLKNYLD